MDTLYYSNYCKHSQKVLNFLVKANLADSINFLCIDKRRKDATSGQILLLLENGRSVPMPPHVHSVPALVGGQGYRIVYGGDEIVQHFQAQGRSGTMANGVSMHGSKGYVQTVKTVATEPLGMALGAATQSFMSEPYTFYNLSTEELSAKGAGGRRQMYNFVSAEHDGCSNIPTPVETYKPDKISGDVTVEKLSQQRNDVFVPKV